MRKATFLLALLTAPFFVSNASASSALDLTISSDTVAVEYRVLDEARGSQWGIGAMYNDDENASLLSATFNVVGEPVVDGDIHTGLGLKGVIHDTFQTAASLALGGAIRYEPEHFQGIGLEGRLYYAPSILNTNNADQYFELVARVTYAVHPQANVFVGVTNVSVQYDIPEVDEIDIQSGINLGFTLMF